MISLKATLIIYSRKFGVLTLMRVLSLILMLCQNVLLLKCLSLNEVGQYYLLATISYVGNAAVFVGADLNLQRLAASDFALSKFSLSGAIDYFFKSAAFGAIVVFSFASIYFFVTGAGTGSWVAAVMCMVTSVSLYASSVLKNILQLDGKIKFVGAIGFSEAALKFLAVVAVTQAGGTTGLAVVSGIAAASAVAAAMGALIARKKITSHPRRIYWPGFLPLAKRIAPVGGSGILNWAQLQAYRPLMIGTLGGEVLGAVALLSTLGSTVANAVYGIIAQIKNPQIYHSGGKSSLAYLKLVSIIALVLAILSIPASYVFLSVTHHLDLLPYLTIVAAGVLLESGNAALGLAINHSNATGQNLWFISLAGILGCSVSLTFLLTNFSQLEPHLKITSALIVGQGLTALLACLYAFLYVGKK